MFWSMIATQYDLTSTLNFEAPGERILSSALSVLNPQVAVLSTLRQPKELLS